MSSMYMGSGGAHESDHTGKASTGVQGGKHGKPSARSVEKQAPAYNRMQAHHSLNQTTQYAHATSNLNQHASHHHQNNLTGYDHHSQQQTGKTSLNKKQLMQKAVQNQHKQLLGNMNYQHHPDQQALYNQLQQSATVNKKPTKLSTAGPRNPQGVPYNQAANMLDFMSVQTAAGVHGKVSSSGGGSSGAPGGVKYPGRVSQSTRHAGKNFDRLNFSSTANQPIHPGQHHLAAAFVANQHSSSSQRQQRMQQMESESTSNSRLHMYENSSRDNRISIGNNTDHDQSSSYHGKTSQLEHAATTHNSIQGISTTTGQTQGSNKRQSFKSNERVGKGGAPSGLKVVTLQSAVKPDFSNMVRQPASTKNNVKKQLDGQHIIMGVSKKTIADSLAINVIPQKMMLANTSNAGHLSTRSGKGTTSVNQGNYINEASLLMQAVSSQLQTPHNHGNQMSGSRAQKGSSQIQNSITNGSQRQSSNPTSQNLHKRKASIQSQNQGQPGNPQHSHQQQLRDSADQGFVSTQGGKARVHQFQTQVVQQKSVGSQRVTNNSNKNSAIKDKKPNSTRTKAPANSGLTKLKLSDTVAQGIVGPKMLQSYQIQSSQPITATNQLRTKKGTNSVMTASLISTKAAKSQERTNTGQKSVTNKYTKVLARVDDLESNPPQIHVQGISSATNKIQKSFNFDTAGLTPYQEMNSIDSQSASVFQDDAGNSRSKKQQLMNQIMYQNQQLASNLTGQQMTSNPPVAMKYLTATGSSTSGTTNVTNRQSQKQSKVQNMKTQQLLLLQQQYAQASNQVNVGATQQNNQNLVGNFKRTSSTKQGTQVTNSSGNTSRKVLFNNNHSATSAKNQSLTQQQQQQLSFVSGKSGISNNATGGVSVVAKSKVIQMQNINNCKVAKSVSSSKPPAHAQYFNSAKIKGDGGNNQSVGDDAAEDHGNTQQEIPNRTAITTGNGKTQIEIQGNQMLCLWNVNIGNGGQANYIDQKGQFNMPYPMFQNTTNMMQGQTQQTAGAGAPQQHQQAYHQQQFNQDGSSHVDFHPDPSLIQNAAAVNLAQNSSKESITHQQQHFIQKGTKLRSSTKPASAGSKIPSQQQTTVRQIDINISRKSGDHKSLTATANEVGLFNKHFKRQIQTKAPQNIRTKKQTSSEVAVGGNNTSQNISGANQSQVKHLSVTMQKAMLDGDSAQSAQKRLVKLIAGNTVTNQNSATRKASLEHSGSQQTKARSVRGSKIKAQNSSSMEQRRGSNQRQPQSNQQRGYSGKKNPSNGKQATMMLLTDSRELINDAQQHMPRVNHSTTNKTTRDTNITFSNDQKLPNQNSLMGQSQQTKQLKQLGMLVNSYFDQQQHQHYEQQQQEDLLQTQTQQNQGSQHKRMQSLVTDPQFITQLGLSAPGDMDAATYSNLVQNAEGNQQRFRGHTTKHTTQGNPQLFRENEHNFQQIGASAKASKTNSNYQSGAQGKTQRQTSKQHPKPAPIGQNLNLIQQMQLLEAHGHGVLSHNSANIISGTSQNAPKAKKPPVAFKEADLAQSDFLHDADDDLIQKMEAEWQQTNNINKRIAKEEALSKEARLAITSKEPFLSLQTANPLMADQSKIKTQDVSEILRRAKQDFNSREAGVEPYEDECVVEETDADEMSYPKHEPAQISSLHKNKASNLSLHTSSTVQIAQKSPKNPSNQANQAQLAGEGTDSLLKGAFMREQKAQLKHQDTATFQQVAESKPPQQPEIPEEAIEYPMPVRQALKLYAKSGKLTDFEKTELLDFKKVYFLGLEAEKIKGKTSAKLHNNGYDDDQGDYHVVLKDHLYYRFEVLDFLGKGSFGQAIKCFDHKTGEIVAVKIIKNKERYQHQAGVELRILQHLQKHDPDDQNNIIQIKDHCIFRNHLIISFELFSINLYEFIKNNNFQGVSLSLIRRFAIQILQSLKFLREEDVIHCDLKPENILLKSPDKSGIKIIDFGSSCFSNQRIYSYIQSRFYRAPEIIIGIPYTTGIDMWSFGCILIELYTGIPIFPGESEMEQLALIMQVFGVPPLKVLANAERGGKFFEEGTNEPLNVFQDQDGTLRLPGSRPLEEIIGTQSETFFDFITQCLKWDPEERITPFQALQHPWVLEGLPQRVLIHHQRMLGLDVPSESSTEALPTAEATGQLQMQSSVSGPAGMYSETGAHTHLNADDYSALRDTQNSATFNQVSGQESYQQQFYSTENQQHLHELSKQQEQQLAAYEQPEQQQPVNMELFYPIQQQHSSAEAANPFELGAADDDYVDEDFNQEVLDVHNRSTQQQPNQVQLPARQIDNGIANQFRVESQQNKQHQMHQGDQDGHPSSSSKPAKQEMSRTQPMPAQFLQGINKKTKQTQHQVQDHEQAQFDNLNYQSLEKGQQMLQYPDLPQYQRYGEMMAPAEIDQMADFLGVDDLVDQEEFQDTEQLNPKSKTTNMSSLLKQINKSIKKSGKQSKYEIETGREVGAKPVGVLPTDPISSTTGTTRYKLPQSNNFIMPASGKHSGGMGGNSDFEMVGQGEPMVMNDEMNGAGNNFSFLMKHRIRQAAGETIPPKSGKSSSEQRSGTSTTTEGTSMGAAGGHHGNNKNVNKIAMNAHREFEMMGDYAQATPHGSHSGAPHQAAAFQMQAKRHAASGQTKQSNSHQAQKQIMNNFLPAHEDIL